VLSASLSCLLVVVPTASAEREFSQRFGESAPGNITMASNTLMTCNATLGGAGCLASEADRSLGITALSRLNNNAWLGAHVDIDDDPSTSNSSSARLTMPSGAKVLWAGLYWVASAPAGMTVLQAKTGQFKGPGETGYTAVLASSYDAAPAVAYGYSSFLEVTDKVQELGSGTYTFGGVPARIGSGNVAAGWSLVVAYQAAGEPLRDLSVFDGSRTIGGTSLVSIPITGFKTPATGTVKSDVGIVAFEGDRGIKGDYAQVNNTVLEDALTPATNFFNSWISDCGVATPGRVPDQGNQLGFDAKIVKADGVLRNGATSAVIRAKTDGEGYQPIVATFATDLYAPNLEVTKTVKDLNGGEVRVGDELEYTLTVKNTGGDGAVATRISERAMPANTSYVSGSMKVDGSSLSDSVNADSGDADGGTGPLQVRLGSGADGASGGLIAPGASHTVKFRVTVTSIPAGGGIISNVAAINYAAQTLGTPVSVDSPRADIRVNVPDLATTKSISSSTFSNGLAASYRIAVKNVGTAATSGTTTVTDQLQPGFLNSPVVSGTGWSCSISGSSLVTCTRSDALAAGASFPNIGISVPSLDRPVNSTISNTASASTALDGDPTNDESTVSTVTGAGVSTIPVSVIADYPEVLPGNTVGVTAQFTNNGPSTATNPVLKMEAMSPEGDVRATGFTVTSSDGSVVKADCVLSQLDGQPAVVTCSPDSLARGVNVEIKIVFRPSPATALDSFDVKGTSSADNFTSGPADATETVNVIPTSDLQITKSSDVSAVDPLGTVTFTIEVTNNGPKATDAILDIRDALPVGLTAVSANWADDASGAGACAILGRSIECSKAAGPIEPPSGSGIKKITVTVVATADAGAHGLLINTATADAGPRDVDLSNNEASADVTVLPWADLELSKVGPTVMKRGGTGAFTLTVTNRGPSTATSTTVTDTIPTGLSPVAPLPKGCAALHQTVTCQAGDLTLGQSVTYGITTRAASNITPGAHLKNVAIARSTVPGRSASADDLVKILVATPANYGLGLKIYGPTASVLVGEVTKLWVKVGAGRASAAKRVVTCINLPSNVSYLWSSGSARGNRVCWQVGTLAAGKSKWLPVTVIAVASGRRSANAAADASNLPRVTDSAVVRTHYPFTG